MKLLLSLSFLSTLAIHSSASLLSFDFADPKGVNTINFTSDAPLESTNGSAKGVTGRVQFDPDAPQNTTGTITVDSSSFHVANPTMNKHLLGDSWMDAANYPDIQFKVAKLNNVATTGNITTADVVGEITIKGVTREISAKTTLSYLKGKLKARLGPNGPDGDILVIRTKFIINRSNFGIGENQNSDKVSDEIEISLSIAGQSPY